MQTYATTEHIARSIAEAVDGDNEEELEEHKRSRDNINEECIN